MLIFILSLILPMTSGPTEHAILSPLQNGGCGSYTTSRYGLSVQCESRLGQHGSRTRGEGRVMRSGDPRAGRVVPPRTVPRITRVAAAITGTNRAGCEVAEGALGAPVICSVRPRPGTGMPQAVVPAISSEAAAYRAIAVLNLTVPEPHLGPDSSELPWDFVPVGYPVWLWTTGGTTGSQTATTTVEGVTVSMRHEPPQLTWNMGDDSQPFTCIIDTPSYVPSADGSATESAVCGYRYEQMGRYQPSVTATWTIHWSAGPDSGVITETLTRSLGEVVVGELQAVVTQRGD